MPIRKRESKRVPDIASKDYAAIMAALEGRPCPPGCRWLLWNEARIGWRIYASWPLVRSIFAALPSARRKAVIQRRRTERLAHDSSRRFHEEQEMRCIPRHDRLYGRPLVHAPPRAPQWDPNDPRLLLRDPGYLEWDGSRQPPSAVRARPRMVAHSNGNGNGNGRH